MMKQKIVLFDIDYTLFKTDTFKKSDLQDHKLYDEVFAVLNKLSDRVKLGIFSEGEFNLQTKKLRRTEIKDFFHSDFVHIVPNKEKALKKVIAKYKNFKIILVDDKLTILKKAQELKNDLITIWVKRGIYAEGQKPIPRFTPFCVASNLNEIISAIENV